MSTCYEQGHQLETNHFGQDDQQSDNLQVFKELPFYSEDSNVEDKMESKGKPGPKVKPKKYKRTLSQSMEDISELDILFGDAYDNTSSNYCLEWEPRNKFLGAGHL